MSTKSKLLWSIGLGVLLVVAFLAIVAANQAVEEARADDASDRCSAAIDAAWNRCSDAIDEAWRSGHRYGMALGIQGATRKVEFYVGWMARTPDERLGTVPHAHLLQEALESLEDDYLRALPPEARAKAQKAPKVKQK